MKIILASASPRRKALIEGLGLLFEVYPSEVDERVKTGESPQAHTLRLALEKTKKARETFHEGWIIGADTVVVIDGRILGKPSDIEEARVMLNLLKGRTHTVFTAFCVLSASTGKRVCRVVESRVKIKDLTGEEMEGYLTTGEPLDKAGAYAVRGIGCFMVESVEGSYTNVVGLPMEELKDALKRLGLL
ncbi:MAG: septum formation protein Maf [Deltaproteobacteria bacterium]|nr:septum formation protein Maf [Deltaproteobacteria bacterium]